MLTIETVRRLSIELGDLPALTRFGLLLLVFAGVLDVFVHLAAADHVGHSGIEHLAHVVGIVGMVLVLAGVVAHGVRRHLSRRALSAANSGGTRDATR
ncbi:MAG: hypothetical protein ACRDGB_10320 [Candidatus Limnocylindria bacterium]